MVNPTENQVQSRRWDNVRRLLLSIAIAHTENRQIAYMICPPEGVEALIQIILIMAGLYLFSSIWSLEVSDLTCTEVWCTSNTRFTRRTRANIGLFQVSQLVSHWLWSM